jgi:hypothetical protein
MPSQHLVAPQEFIELTKIDLTQFYVLYEGGKLPIIKRRQTVYIDINDGRAQKYMPDYKFIDLFK